MENQTAYQLGYEAARDYRGNIIRAFAVYNEEVLDALNLPEGLDMEAFRAGWAAHHSESVGAAIETARAERRERNPEGYMRSLLNWFIAERDEDRWPCLPWSALEREIWVGLAIDHQLAWRPALALYNREAAGA